MQFINRFWEKVRVAGEDDCWLWQGATNARGYGQLGVTFRGHKAAITAHRLSFLLHYGPPPTDWQVCHSCDNPPCVNPRHLWTGTNGDNQRDSFAKGRRTLPIRRDHSGGSRSGELAVSAKLTNQQAEDIRWRWRAGERQTALAREYGVSQSAISNITRRVTYATLP